MDKLLQWIKTHLPTRRRLIQLYAALLYNAHARGFITGSIFTGPTKALCVPGLNCYSCPGAIGACPLGALQNALASSGSRAPSYVLGILLLFGLTLGRTICGFACPVGLLQELVHKLPTPKVQKSRVTRALSWMKYVLLAVLVILVPLWYGVKDLPLPAFCKYVCPAGTLEGAVGLLLHPDNGGMFAMLGSLFTSKFVILVLVLTACVFVYRAFCRFLCPLGAIYGLFARVALVGVKVDAPRCTGCGACVRQCPMDVRRVGDHECIHCTACIDACPTGAITLRAGRAVLQSGEPCRNSIPQQKRPVRTAAAWGMALLLLAVLIWANQPQTETSPTQTAAVDETIPVGSEAGMRASDFTIPLYGGGSWTLSEHLGQVTVLNFWATWCGPCVKELPHFDLLAAKYPQDVAVAAIHSHLVTEDVPAWLARQSYSLPFALDEDGSVIAGFGGALMLPQTVIIDRSGVIRYNQVGSLDHATLLSLVTPLLSE